MGKYRKVDPRVWNDAKFRNLSDRAKLAFFFLLTHPHMTPLGAMRQTIPGLAAELGWSEKAFREAFGEALAKGMAKHDEEAAMIWLPKFMRYNLPESPNVLRSWRHGADTLPECDLFFTMIQEVKALSEGLGEGFQKAFTEAFPEARRQPSPNQEQEQEQEQEPTGGSRKVGGSGGGKTARSTRAAATKKTTPKKGNNGQGTRIPDDWNLTDERLAYATERGLTPAQACTEAEKFVDYWRSATGQRARKADWDATWRNWIRRASEQLGTSRQGNGVSESKAPERADDFPIDYENNPEMPVLYGMVNPKYRPPAHLRDLWKQLTAGMPVAGKES